MTTAAPRPDARPNPSPREDWLRALAKTAPIDRQPHRLLPTVIDELAASQGDRPAIVSEHEHVTFQQLSHRAHAYAAWALTENIQPGDRVGLLMTNCAEYIAIWLGIVQVGGVVALLNTNLRGPALAHSITAADPAHMIVDGSLASALHAALPELAYRPKCWTTGNLACDFPPLTLPAGPDAALITPLRPISIADPALLIYTSGTTGLPKAAYVSHRRIMMWSHWFAGMMSITPSDRIYNCLPLYHSIGGVVAVGAALTGGGSVLVREKFSASRFWQDVASNDCTIFQYIGELCRYLVTAPPSPNETRHDLRLACGNGLAGGVWESFQRRFAIPRILEFYAATEGNFSLYNCEGKPGAIGRVPAFLSHRFNVKLIALDHETSEPLRSPDDRCIPCAAGQTGEAIGEVRSDQAPGTFEGYTNRQASEKKLLHNVFTEGDTWVRSGDLMRQDAQGFYYFVDRVGDTFRWKGENVSTTEVQAVLASVPGVQDSTVYGVAVPGCEGRAGMAALVVDPAFNMADLLPHLARHLPDYAQPLFIRLCAALDTTATFRPRKSYLASEGFDPALITDPLYFRDAMLGFIPLDAPLFERLIVQTVRV